MNARIELIQTDITRLEADAIVNAANNELLPGGGVCGAIFRAAGPALAEACGQIGWCETGHAVLTSAGNLKARYVIHAVGPLWQGGAHREEQLLESAYRNSLKLAAAHQLRSVAFPNISTGIYGYPKEAAAAAAIRTVTDFLEYNQFPEKVIFCCFDKENLDIYRKLLRL
ncbi:MAG: O-acetyl-ADP-ribose deacetylase [Cyclobacteriaceae bacterium]|nr:MAG: O-acetyl-ADP-ribose deacetylase [Cyclobacteriaceae bacterium]